MCRRADSAGASEDFSNVCVTAVRGIDTGRTQILAHHIVQSFAPDEVTPEQALQIGEELCDRFLQGNYQYVLAVHTDKSHTHCHIIFNNTNLYNGLSFTTEHNQGRKETELVKLITAECRSTGNIQKLLKRLFAGTVEQIFEAEMDEHLGYEKNSVLGNNSGNSRNGYNRKTIKSDYGDCEIAVPRDRNGEFEPKIIAKRQTHTDEIEDKIMSMYAKGMSQRDIEVILSIILDTFFSNKFQQQALVTHSSAFS